MNRLKLNWETLKQKKFLIELVTSALDWQVDAQDIPLISTRKEFINIHIANSGSQLVLTKRILCYPDRTIFALCTIGDAECLRILLNFLATEGKILFERFNPAFYLTETDTILTYLYRFYYRIKFEDRKWDSIMLNDYLKMVLSNGGSPNLKIKSPKRIVLEHDRLVTEIILESIPEFEVEDAGILPAEKCGYYFTFINSKEKLVAEAKEMKHCVAIYAVEIISGKSIIYSVDGRERATVEFRDFGYGLSLCQVFTYFDKEVSTELQLLLSSMCEDGF
jgi:hypothetical protein